MGKSIVFIDTGIDAYQELARGIDASIECVFLASDRDGAQQIADYLIGRTEIDALHIISHGAPGRLYLGSAPLSNETLPIYEPILRNIGSALSSSGDILIYGCGIAGDSDGKEFLARLAELTGADVSASSDLTGSALRGGDAILEAQFGSVDALPILPQSVLDEYDVVLAFAPYFYDARIIGLVDQDGDGYARQFNIEFDADSDTAGHFYVAIYADDGPISLHDFRLTTGHSAVDGTAADWRSVTIASDTCSSELAHGGTQLHLDLSDAATNALVQSWQI